MPADKNRQKANHKQPFDIRKYKASLRKKYKDMRSSMPLDVKTKKDANIFEHIIRSKFYKDAKIVLCYVSTQTEINTHNFINKALKDGKTVGVPYCIEGTREMDFYSIKSLDELERRTFGVLEPVAEKSQIITDFTDSICIMPGLSFDKFGYRIGYGGGYYDRFLSSKYNGKVSIGVCYQKAVRYQLTHGYFDVPCNYITTENGMRASFKKSKNKKKHSRSK